LGTVAVTRLRDGPARTIRKLGMTRGRKPLFKDYASRAWLGTFSRIVILPID
jgi:hypothetical protein